uniref:HECT domain-containing protein n=1 Tax=Pundamilia nyererei TaxID=303518 RepID=A0A3B4H4I7_9CICH
LYVSAFLLFQRTYGLRSLGVLDALQTYPLQMKWSNVFQDECRTLFFYLIVENDVSLEDILVFCTGCDSIPALGFSPKPILEFVTNCRFPVANTCENILRIPVHAVYTTFKSDMDFLSFISLSHMNIYALPRTLY